MHVADEHLEGCTWSSKSRIRMHVADEHLEACTWTTTTEIKSDIETLLKQKQHTKYLNNAW